MKNTFPYILLVLVLLSCESSSESPLNSKLEQLEKKIDATLDSLHTDQKRDELKRKSQELFDSSKVMIEENLRQAEELTKKKLKEAEKKIDEMNTNFK